jgi:L-2,4-diaminobutyrate transaminase
MNHQKIDPATLEAIDRRTVFHPSTQLKSHAQGEGPAPTIIASGDGIRVTDVYGNEWIDAFAGLYCTNIGYNRREIADAITQQANKLAFYHAYAGHSHEPVIRLSERLLGMAPAGMSKVYYGQSGTDANETQLKLVWYYNNVLGRPEKKKVISRDRAYHGSSVAAGSLTGLPVFHKAFDLPIEPIRHTRTPHWYWHHAEGEDEETFARRCADELESMILAEAPETVAAFIGEPVLGTGGIIPPPAGYWREIQRVLHKYDVLLIADEVVTAFGRIGAEFGCTNYDMQPDLITTAKGLTSGYLPLSAVLVGDRVWSVLEQGSEEMGPIGHGYTYSSHPLCVAAANANLDVIEREGLVANARDVGAYLQQQLHATFAEHPLVGEVRGVGMLGALEFVADRDRRQPLDARLKVGARVYKAGRERGLLGRAMPHGDILGLAPPLMLQRGDVDRVVEVAREAVDAVTDELAREGHLWVAR